MTMKRFRLAGTAAGAFLYAFALPAFAQETAPQPKPKTPAEIEAEEEEAREAAVRTVETFEATDEKPETLEETFFRLSRDFVATSDDGFRRLGSVPIWPRGELKIGGFRIFPYLREAVEFENNFFRQPNTGPSSADEGLEREWTWVNEVGLLADKALMGGRLRVSGSADSVWNVRFGENSPDTWDFSGQVGATYTFPSGVWLRGGYHWERRHDPADFPGVTNDFGRTNQRAFFSLGLDRDIFFGSKLRYEAGIQTNNETAQDESFEDIDRQETTVYLKASYPFLRRDETRIFGLVRYRRDDRQSERLNDGDTVGFNVGIEGTLPLREGEYRSLRGQVSIGFEDSLYSNDDFRAGEARGIADSDRDATNLSLQVAIQYLMSPRTTWDLRYLHGTEFSFFGNYQVVDRVDLAFTHNVTRQLTGRIAAFYEHTDPSSTRPNETIPGNEFSTSANNVNRLGLGAGIRYVINEWLDLDLSADMERRNDHTDFSYTNYRGVLGLTFYLNALTPRARSAALR